MAACPACGFSNAPGESFCGGCGAALPSASTPAEVPPFTVAPSTSQRPFIPPHLAERILTSREALEGERKQVTVLFADIRGSLELLRGRDPEEARELLDPALQAMMEAVHRFEGTVSNLMGDGLMALFGAPLALEDHAARACYAALAMQGVIRSYADQVRRSHGVEVQIRVGLHSGEVVVRAIGSDLHMDYSAIGQTVHLASRMEQLAPPGTIRLTADTVRLAEGLIQVRPLGPVPVKGLPEPVLVFELLGAEPLRRRLQAAAARGLSPFVGRGSELAELERSRARAAAGQGQVVGVVGDPGVGKSRLFWEFIRSPAMAGWLVLESSCPAHGRATAYLPILELLRGYVQVEPGDDPRKVREKLTGKILALDETLKSTLLPLQALFEVPVEEPEWRALDPPERRRRILDAGRRLLLRESRVQPLCLVVEDLHWIDSESQALLDLLTESLPGARVLLLVNYRPEYAHDWAGKSFFTQLRIDPLPPATAEELLEGLLGTDGGLAGLRRFLIERTEGNPFFLEESVRALAETGVLEGVPGAYRLVKDLAMIRVPASIQAVLAARIDRLPAEEKRLLQCASVIGKDVPFALLHAVADLPEPAVRRALARLREGEFLYETQLFPDLAYTFRHALTHEVAYGSLIHDRRRALHARLVEAIELLHPQRLGEHAERLAHHAVRGEVWEKAPGYLRLAGSRAVARSANREAVALFEQALAALARLPATPERRQLAIDLRFDLRSSLFALGEFGKVLDHLLEAEALADALGDASRLGRVYSYMTNYWWQMGDHERAIETGERALVIARAQRNFVLEVATNFYMGQAYHNLGRFRLAADFNRRNVERLETVPPGDPAAGSPFLVLSRTWLVWALSELGEFAEGRVRGEEGLRIAQRVKHPFVLTHAYIGIGPLYIRKGEWDKAIPALETALELSRTWDFPVFLPILEPLLGHAYSLSGRVDEGISLLEQSLEQAVSQRLIVAQSLRLMFLAEAYVVGERFGEALPLLERALELSRGQKEQGYVAWELRLLGEIARRSHPSDAGASERHYRDALGHAEELGMRPLQAQCHLGLGHLHREAGRSDEARAELTAAVDLLRSMEMTFWLGPAEEALARLEQAVAP